MKRIIVGTWLTLGLAAVLTGCQEQEDVTTGMDTGTALSVNAPVVVDEVIDTDEAATEVDAYGMNDEYSAINEEIRSQLVLIAENRDLWIGDPDGFYGYAVTDLDHNARLEIITSICEGTGLYTNSIIYEVNEDHSGLTECAVSWQEGDSQADIMVTSVPVYYDGDTNQYFYIFEDVCKVNAAEYFNSMHAVSLHNGVLEDTIIATQEIIYEDAEAEPYIRGEDIYGRTLSEEDYVNIANSTYEDLQMEQGNIIWLMGMTEQLLDMSVDQMESTLVSSYGGFAGEVPR
ncbi:MAG TPA: hypothetical protein PLZ77_04705 [Lachnospiraceae bacterium]|nr:hypothetical protein [Lachnospiraceae bacterium]